MRSTLRRTVEELETAGVCGLSIEDTVLPRPYGSTGKPTLTSVEEGIGKMKAALSARQDKDVVIASATMRAQAANLQVGSIRSAFSQYARCPGSVEWQAEQEVALKNES
jgi:2-methylisocitrate lyase-like PEP mutase family enzyme